MSHTPAEGAALVRIERRLRVFLSYASEDKRSIRKLLKRLRAHGFDPWMDEEGIPPGVRWEQHIRRSLRRADAIIVCLSPSLTSKRGFVRSEIALAARLASSSISGRGTYLIPVRIEECQVPVDLANWQALDLYRRDGWNALVRALSLRQLAIGIMDPAPRRRINQNSIAIRINRDGHRAKCSATIYYDVPWEQYGYGRGGTKSGGLLLRDVIENEKVFIDPLREHKLAQSIERVVIRIRGQSSCTIADRRRNIGWSQWGFYVSREFTVDPRRASKHFFPHCPRLGIDLIELDADFARQVVAVDVAKAVGEQIYLADPDSQEDWDFEIAEPFFRHQGFRQVKKAIVEWISTVMVLRGVSGKAVTPKVVLPQRGDPLLPRLDAVYAPESVLKNTYSPRIYVYW